VGVQLLPLIISANSPIMLLITIYKEARMDSNFSATYLLQHLESIAAQLDIEVCYEDLSDEEILIRSGGCKLLGRNLILIDSRRSTPEQAQILARELSKHDLEDLYILPQVREFIFSQSAPREKNLPHR